MYEVLNFFSKFWLFIFFIFLEITALSMTYSEYEIYKSIYTNYVHNIVGVFYKKKHDIKSFFLLKDENKKLIEENAMLRKELNVSKIIRNIKSNKLDNIFFQKYIYIPVKIINNSIFQQENFIVIDKGELEGIQIDMGIVLPNGIAGIIIKTSTNFSTAISLLNTKIKINARLRKSKYFGTIIWDGINHDIVILKDIPKHIKIKIGDIIETDSKSTIFPEGIIIGKIKNYKLNQESSTYNIKVKLQADFGSIENAYVVNNLFKNELKQVQIISN